MYVYAVGLHSAGRKREARTVVDAVLKPHPGGEDCWRVTAYAFFRVAGRKMTSQTSRAWTHEW
jgi:hypothetical protein